MASNKKSADNEIVLRIQTARLQAQEAAAEAARIAFATRQPEVDEQIYGLEWPRWKKFLQDYARLSKVQERKDAVNRQLATYRRDHDDMANSLVNALDINPHQRIECRQRHAEIAHFIPLLCLEQAALESGKTRSALALKKSSASRKKSPPAVPRRKKINLEVFYRLAHLAPQQKRYLSLHEEYGLSIPDIARFLHKSPKTVRQTVENAENKMRASPGSREWILIKMKAQQLLNTQQ